MKRLLLRPSLLLAVVLLFAACNNDNEVDTAPVTLNFRANYGGQALQILEEPYSYPENVSLRVQLFQFYLSDIALVRADASLVPLSEIELVRFQDQTTAAEAATGTNLEFSDIPTGEYTGLRFGLGVHPDLNGLDPTNFQQPYPLDDTNYWSWATGYVYSKIEASVDTSGNGQYDLGISYHIGNDSLYTEVAFQRPVSVTSDGANQLNFAIDLQDVLVKGNEYLDVRNPNEQLIHANKPALHSFLWGNLRSALLMQQ